MTSRSTSSPVLHADPTLLEKLRCDLSAADFTVTGVRDVLGPLASRALDREQALPARRAASESPAPAATLVRLFTLGDAVDVKEAAAALPALGIEGAQRLGLVAAEGDAVVALADLRPYAADESHWWVASDLGEMAVRAPLRPDHVLGIGGASTTLASWTSRAPVHKVLDLGTGCGVQALHLAAHAEHIVVSDVSERALDYARFNAALNGMSWEFRAGSMFEPVRDEQFDLIVSNPPFVITPRSGAVPLFEYRDGGQAGDAVVAGLVRSVGDYLLPGGVAQFLGNWEIPEGGDWKAVVTKWLEGTGLDAWIVQREVQDPAQYAETWARDGGHFPGTADFDTMYAAWLDDFASREVGSIGFGVITLRRPLTGRPPVVDLVEAFGPVQQPMGEAVRAGLIARDLLAERSDEDLLNSSWVAAADIHVETHTLVGAEDPSTIRVRQGGGLGRTIELTTVTAAFVSVCDGELTAAQSAAAIAGLLGAEGGAVSSEIVSFIREAAADGVLTEA